MATLPSYFVDFLARVRPGDDINKELQDAHKTLRDRLAKDEDLATILVSDFLQGSYRRATAVKPGASKRADVDVVIVTSLDEGTHTPDQALKKFVPFLDAHYEDQYRLQGRSIGIDLDAVTLDLVVTSAPSEIEQEAARSAEVRAFFEVSQKSEDQLYHFLAKAAADEEWRKSPLRIPDCDARRWEDTHPLEQIRWTHEKNARCNSHYVNVVKSLKWWHQTQHSNEAHPKSYPFEHLIGVACPDGIESVAAGVAQTLESIRDTYASFAQAQITPVVPDHGVPSHNVLKRTPGADFSRFHARVSAAATIARQALNLEDIAASAREWRKLFGDEFPEPPSTSENSGSAGGGFSPRSSVSTPRPGRFA